MRECKEHEIPLWKFLRFCHGWTERIGIYIVGGAEAMEDKFSERYLTKNAFEGKRTVSESVEEERLLKYFKDVPLWNLHLEYEFLHFSKEQGKPLTGMLVANCHYADCREGLLVEKEDIRREKRRAYRARKRNEPPKEGD